MRLVFFSLLVATPCLAQDVEVFTDRGDTFVRAGSDQGLQRGTSLDVLSGKGGKKIGTALVMETWPQLARVSLDEPAKNDKAASKAVSLAKQPAVAPPPPPPPPAAPGALKGRAVYAGAGPWTALQVVNESKVDWTDCTVTMLPMNASYRLSALPGDDHELIARSNFSNNEFSGDPKEVRVTCKQGTGVFPLR